MRTRWNAIPPRAVIDAGPLFSALISNFNIRDIDRGLRPRLATHLKPFLRSDVCQRDLLTVFAAIPDKFTTSHVIGELQGLQTSRLRLFGEDLFNFWSASINLLRQWRFTEELVRLLDLASEEHFATSMPRIGPPDAGLIRLAREHRCILVTEDERTLVSEAWAAKVECKLLQELLPPTP